MTDAGAGGAGSSPGARDSVAPLYADWAKYRRRMVDGIRGLTEADLALRGAPDHWPIWAITAHLAGARAYWLCGVLGEPGADATPFPAPFALLGWEDELDAPRSVTEIVDALESTSKVIDGCLARWSPPMLQEAFPRDIGTSQPQMHTRQSVLLRLITHDAFHAGEIALTLGMHGRPILDLWPPSRPEPPIA
ncbi:MAG: DinB family protein [Chloroflexota bacterium]